MISLLLALQFLTIIPIPCTFNWKDPGMNENKIAKSMIYFPLVGLLLGLILSAINNISASLNFGQFVSSIITIVSLIILTGGLHLDGLSDTIDAFLSRKPKDEMLKIMRDSHIGVMGVLALICVILLKISFLSSIITPLKTASLILMCVFSRWSLVFVMFVFPYARTEGKAKIFIEVINLKIFVLATLIVLVCGVLIGGLKGLLVLGIIAMNAYVIGKIIKNKIAGITGDTLGAINELTEVIVLFIICLLERGGQWTI